MELVRQEELAFVGGSKKFDFWSMDLVLVRGDRGVPWTSCSCVLVRVLNCGSGSRTWAELVGAEFVCWTVDLDLVRGLSWWGLSW